MSVFRAVIKFYCLSNVEIKIHIGAEDEPSRKFLAPKERGQKEGK